ncbi:MAG TPA: IPT/TIG domain-containing protein [Gaiellaceae bacterium]|nr:IPT/TIG domain-containing protein [Gaiellaceae bacterium]
MSPEPGVPPATWLRPTTWQLHPISRPYNRPPTVAGFGPPTAVAGATVRITGSNLLGTSAVSFNGRQALILSTTATKLKVLVPAGGSDGPITLTTPGGTAAAAQSFVYKPSLPPTVTAISPTTAVAGATLSITGSNFLGTTSITVNGKRATITSTTSTKLKATVPSP